MKRPAKAKKTKKKPSKVQSLVDETIAESKSLEQEIAKTIAKSKRSKTAVKLDKKVASLSKADQKKYSREVEKTIQKKKRELDPDPVPGGTHPKFLNFLLMDRMLVPASRWPPWYLW